MTVQPDQIAARLRSGSTPGLAGPAADPDLAALLVRRRMEEGEDRYRKGFDPRQAVEYRLDLQDLQGAGPGSLWLDQAPGLGSSAALTVEEILEAGRKSAAAVPAVSEPALDRALVRIALTFPAAIAGISRYAHFICLPDVYFVALLTAALVVDMAKFPARPED